MHDDADRWNARYRGRSTGEPSMPKGLGGIALARGGRCLDVACGLGEQTIWAAQQGFEVVALDASDVLGGSPYVLEVTSPGVDRPLTERRHWARARGRVVVAELGDRPEPVSGRVTVVSDDGVARLTDDGTEVLAWEHLRRGRVQVEFTRRDAQDEEA